jgi:CheY-like chemotaxis protein
MLAQDRRRHAVILVVDDDPQIRELVGDILGFAGYPVTAVDDGQAALALIPGLRPDLVITDLHMPDQDGLTVIREVRRLHPGVRLIAITGDGRYSDLAPPCLQMARLLGADYWLQKPFGAAELLKVVAFVLNQEPGGTTLATATLATGH